jgi:hypothetical protein
MNDIYETLRGRMQEARDNSDIEAAHSDADVVLIDALREAASGNLSPYEADVLIDIWHDVQKWYA